jgi:hypothetical protein
MAEGCKRKGMHKSMLCQLLKPEIFQVISVFGIVLLSTLFAAEPEVMGTLAK